MLFDRHTKVYLEQASNIWEIPVLPGYGFDVPIAVDTYKYDTTRKTTGDWNERYTVTDIKSKGPITWNFSTNIRPFVNTTDSNHHCVEEALWANLVAKNSYNGSVWSKGITSSTSFLNIDFSESNSSKLNTFTLYFVLGWDQADTQTYKLTNCCIDKASCNFSSSNIGGINWSGFAEAMESGTTYPTTGYNTDGILSDNNYIISKLSYLSIVAEDTTTFPGTGSGSYLMAVDDVSLNFSNNIETYMTDNMVGSNIASSHLLGSKEISGSFKAYLDLSSGSSKDLFEDLHLDDSSTNTFELIFYLGGASVPKVAFEFPKAQLIPSIEFGNVISTSVNFKAKYSSSVGSESTIKYYGDITDS